MFEGYAFHNVIASIIAGMGIGLLVAIRYRRPRGWIAFGLLVLLMLISPSVGVHTRLIGIGNAIENPAHSFIIHCNIFLLSFTMTLNVGFIWRIIRGYKPAMY